MMTRITGKVVRRLLTEPTQETVRNIPVRLRSTNADTLIEGSTQKPIYQTLLNYTDWEEDDTEIRDDNRGD